jgi:hypothetical protein
MQQRKKAILLGLPWGLLVLGLCATSAMAGTASGHLDMATQAPGVCRPALPAFETQVRSRPLAMQNEGTTTVFVTCAIPQFTSLSDDALGVGLNFTNTGSAEANVSCVGVIRALQPYTYVPQSTTVPAHTDPTVEYHGLVWNDTIDPFPGNYTMISCALPPGVGISKVYSFGAEVLLAPPQ